MLKNTFLFNERETFHQCILEFMMLADYKVKTKK